MRVNSDTANKLVRQLNAARNRLLLQEQAVKTYSYLQDETPYIPAYSFAETREKLNRMNEAILTLKHAINVFNTTTVLTGTETTIDMALVQLPMLSTQVSCLENMCNIPEKTRTINLYAKTAEYTCSNFDTNEAKAAYREASEKLMALQDKLNTANLAAYFDVDVDLTDLL